MTKNCVKVLIEEHPTEFKIRIEGNASITTKTDTAIALLERKWHIDAQKSGACYMKKLTSESWKIGSHKTLSQSQIVKILEQLLSESLVDLLRQAKFHPLEAGYLEFETSTKPEVLRAWALRHYKASGINHPDSINQVSKSRQIRYEIMNLDRLRPNLECLPFCNPDLIDGYSELMQEGIQFPPLIASYHYNLLEGYHRYAALQKARIQRHSVIKL
ncbi:hypothetical protein ACQ4M3_12905 [Leptolyngbya sp. AN03gr2]|uniref:hypothetical protein n=1 Tax=unclassified Leptolyngbya TaxID=2650499 RepID=UPI003D31056A